MWRTRRGSNEYGLDWTKLAAVGQIESDQGRSQTPGVTQGTNPSGAAGPALDYKFPQTEFVAYLASLKTDPSLFGKVSFPSQGSGDTIRAYIKDSMLRYDREDDDELGGDDEYYDGGEETDDMTEIEFDGNTEPEE